MTIEALKTELREQITICDTLIPKTFGCFKQCKEVAGRLFIEISHVQSKLLIPAMRSQDQIDEKLTMFQLAVGLNKAEIAKYLMTSSAAKKELQTNSLASNLMSAASSSRAWSDARNASGLINSKIQ